MVICRILASCVTRCPLHTPLLPLTYLTHREKLLLAMSEQTLLIKHRGSSLWIDCATATNDTVLMTNGDDILADAVSFAQNKLKGLQVKVCFVCYRWSVFHQTTSHGQMVAIHRSQLAVQYSNEQCSLNISEHLSQLFTLFRYSLVNWASHTVFHYALVASLFIERLSRIVFNLLSSLHQVYALDTHLTFALAETALPPKPFSYIFARSRTSPKIHILSNWSAVPPIYLSNLTRLFTLCIYIFGSTLCAHLLLVTLASTVWPLWPLTTCVPRLNACRQHLIN